jgi:hypothetical protein
VTRFAVSTALLTAAVVMLAPATADAASSHTPLVMGGIPVLGGLLHGVGSVFHSITGAVLGAFTWTIKLATDFILTTIAALVHMLIPQSWVNKGLQIMRWIVAVPNYGGLITSPSGAQSYGFAGVNALRETFGWIGISLVPLSLIYACGRAMIGEGDPIGVPVTRLLLVAAGVIFYPFLWGQFAALANQASDIILSVPAVSSGLHKLMEYAVGGVALGGWQLIDLGLMGAVSLELLALIFMKVVVIILGAFLYVTGPVMIGLVPTRAGADIARAWLSAVVALLAVGIVWSAMFAVGAVLINDAGTAGPLIGGNSDIGNLFGGLLLAVAAVVCLWLCLKVTREAASVLRMQFIAMATLRGHSSGASSTNGGASRFQASSGHSVREFGRRVSAAASGAGSELAASGAGLGPGTMAAARRARTVGREGLLGTAAIAGRSAAHLASPRVASTVSRSPAGAVAVRMARAGTASWQSTKTAQHLQSAAHSANRGAGTGRSSQRGRGAEKTATPRGTRPARAVSAVKPPSSAQRPSAQRPGAVPANPVPTASVSRRDSDTASRARSWNRSAAAAPNSPRSPSSSLTSRPSTPTAPAGPPPRPTARPGAPAPTQPAATKPAQRPSAPAPTQPAATRRTPAPASPPAPARTPRPDTSRNSAGQRLEPLPAPRPSLRRPRIAPTKPKGKK